MPTPSIQVPLTANSMVNGVLWDGWKWDFGANPHDISYFLANDSGIGWTAPQTAAYAAAINAIGAVANLNISIAATRADATMVENVVTSAQMASMAGSGVYGFHDTPDTIGPYTQTIDGTHSAAFLAGQVGGFYNNALSFTDTAIQPGGNGGYTLVHELGHGFGLKHPHNNIGSAPRFPGVTSSSSLGTNNQNHGFWTMMSYNVGYTFDAAGQIALNNSGVVIINGQQEDNFGYIKGPMAYDIAALQYMYGTKAANTGDTFYDLPDADVNGVGWTCIWDTGGNDTLRYTGARNVILDLTAATLDGSTTGGGVLSYAANIHGGYTIANGVVVENAVAGSGADQLVGNQAGNSLDGGDGADTMFGAGGNDTMYGAGGDDTLLGGSGDDALNGDGSIVLPTGVGAGSGLVTHAYGNISIATALDVTNTFNFTSNPDIVNSTTAAHTTARFIAPASGAVTASYYAITLNAGTAITLDIDHTDSLDSYIRLLDAAGLVLAENDDAGGDTGGINSLDSSLTFTVTLTASYYVSVGRFANGYSDTLSNNAAYDLNVSVSPALPIGNNGVAGNDTLDGGAGADTLNGGAGVNTASYASALVGVRAVLFDESNNTGDAAGDVYISIQNLTGTLAGDSLFGDALANTLDGAGGTDVLFGLAGNDILIGGGAGAGAYNQLWGGADSDTASYAGVATDVYADIAATGGWIKNGVGVLILTDAYNSIENLTGGLANDTLVGDASGNVLNGAGGNDILFGMDGDDTLIGGGVNGPGYNQLWGGANNDTASYGAETTSVTADLVGGWAFVGGVNLANLRDVFNSIENLTGGAALDVLMGDAGANIIEGRAGADQLYGRGGIDTFVYRAYADSNIAGGYDTIADFVAGVDRIDLRAFNTDAAHVEILSSGGATKLLVEATPGVFNGATDLAIAFFGGNALTTADIMFA